MMLLHADGTHETVTIRACGTTRGGLPVVLVDGAAFVVADLGTVAQLVAQTFDSARKSTAISARIGSGAEGSYLLDADPNTGTSREGLGVKSTRIQSDQTTNSEGGI